MRHAPKFDAFLETHGQSVSGTLDRALAREDATAAIALAREEGLPLLGGDIFVSERGRLRPANLNWFTDPRPGETEVDFRRRSWYESETFLQEFNWDRHPNAFVVFVRAP
jgi:hypothetical protein